MQKSIFPYRLLRISTRKNKNIFTYETLNSPVCKNTHGRYPLPFILHSSLSHHPHSTPSSPGALSLSLPTSYPFSSLSAVGSGGGQVRRRKLPPLPSPPSRQRWRARAAGEGEGGARRPMAATLHPRSSGTGGGGGATMVEPAVGRCGRPTLARRWRIA